MAIRVCMLVRNDCRTDYRVLKEAASLARAGYQVTVIGVHTYGPGEREERQGFTIVRVPVASARTPVGKAIELFPRALRRMAAAAMATQAAVYHAHDSDTILPAWWAARATPGARLIYDAHEVGFYSLRESLTGFPFRLPVLTWLWDRWNDRIVRRYVDAVITVNEALAEVQAAHYGIPRPVVVMNCPPRFEPTPAMQTVLPTRLGLDPTTPIALVQGMFSPGRGDGPPLEAVVRSASLLQEGVVVILGNVGSRPEWAYLRRLAAEPPYAGRVFILPPVPPDTLLVLTSGARVGLIPMRLSGLMRLALPNKLFEYAAAGIPVITPDLPVIRSVVERFGYGVFCDFAGPTAVAEAITAVLADPDRYAAMQAGARAAAAVYNWEAQEAVLLDLYRRVLGR